MIRSICLVQWQTRTSGDPDRRKAKEGGGKEKVRKLRFRHHPHILVNGPNWSFVLGWSGSRSSRCPRCYWTGSMTPTAPSTFSLGPTMSSWRRFGSSLPRSGRYSLINKKDKRPQDCCKDAKTILEEEVVSTAIENDAKGVYNGEDFPNWKWTLVIKRVLLICLHRLFNDYVLI